MALPDPADGATVDIEGVEEQSRRFALLKTFLSAFLVAGIVGIPGWVHDGHPTAVGLSAILVPAGVASCLLIAVCAGFSVLYPWPRLTPLLGFTSAAMHTVVMAAFATVLTVRPSALMGLPVQMEGIARWATLRLSGVGFLAEALVLSTYAAVYAAVRSSRPSGVA